MKEDYNVSFLMKVPPPPNCEIWIADDVVIHCRKRFQWWQRFMIKLFFGWKVKMRKREVKKLIKEDGYYSCSTCHKLQYLSSGKLQKCKFCNKENLELTEVGGAEGNSVA